LFWNGNCSSNCTTVHCFCIMYSFLAAWPGHVSMASLVDPTLMLDRSSRCTSTRSSTQRMSLRKATPVLLAYQYHQDRVSHQPLYKYYEAYSLSQVRLPQRCKAARIRGFPITNKRVATLAIPMTPANVQLRGPATWHDVRLRYPSIGRVRGKAISLASGQVWAMNTLVKGSVDHCARIRRRLIGVGSPTPYTWLGRRR
jgi:hypothetical protein